LQGYRPAWRGKRIVFDTSALMLAADGVPVFDLVEEVVGGRPECIILEPVLRELEKHARSRSVKKRVAARLALQLIERRGCRIVEYGAGRIADDAIVEYVLQDREATVVTADTGLHKRLLRMGIPHLYYREESRRFETTGGV